MSLNASAWDLAPFPMRSATSPSAGATARHTVAVVMARGAIGNGDGAQAAFLFVGERTACKIERVGAGAEGQEGDAEGEKIGGTHREWCVCGCSEFWMRVSFEGWVRSLERTRALVVEILYEGSRWMIVDAALLSRSCLEDEQENRGGC